MSELLLVKRPEVAGLPRKTPVAVAATTLAMLGLGVFLWLSEARAAQQENGSALPPLATTTTPAPDVLPAAAAPAPPAAAQGPFFIPNSGPVTLMPSSQQPQPQPSGFATVLSPRVQPVDRMAGVADLDQGRRNARLTQHRQRLGVVQPARVGGGGRHGVLLDA